MATGRFTNREYNDNRAGGNNYQPDNYEPVQNRFSRNLEAFNANATESPIMRQTNGADRNRFSSNSSNLYEAYNKVVNRQNYVTDQIATMANKYLSGAVSAYNSGSFNDNRTGWNNQYKNLVSYLNKYGNELDKDWVAQTRRLLDNTYNATNPELKAKPLQTGININPANPYEQFHRVGSQGADKAKSAAEGYFISKGADLSGLTDREVANRIQYYDQQAAMNLLPDEEKNMDYWQKVDWLVKNNKMSADEAEDYMYNNNNSLDEFVNHNTSPVFAKNVAPTASQLLQRELDIREGLKGYEDRPYANDYMFMNSYNKQRYGYLGERERTDGDRGNTRLDPNSMTQDVKDRLFYDSVNGDENARQLLSTVKADYKTGLNQDITVDINLEQYMDKKQVEMFNYLYAKEGKDSAMEYYSKITPILEKKYNQAYNEEIAEAVKDPAKAASLSIASVLFKPMLSIGRITAGAKSAIEGKEIDPYDPTFTSAGFGDVARSNISQNIKDSAGGLASMGYDAGMSTADVVYNMLIGNAIGGALGLTGESLSKASEWISLGIMGTDAATSTTINNMQAGLSFGDAAVLGFAAGGIEIITEKIGMDNMLNSVWRGKNAWISWAKQTLAEGAEEVLSDVMNDTFGAMYDALTERDVSEWKREMNAYIIANGLSPMDEDKAFMAVFSDHLSQMGRDFLTGAISGGGMGAFGTVNQTLQSGAIIENMDNILTAYGIDRNNIDAFDALVREAKTVSEGKGKTAKMADTLLNKKNSGVEITDSDITDFIRTMYYDGVMDENGNFSGSPELDDEQFKQSMETADFLSRQFYSNAIADKMNAGQTFQQARVAMNEMFADAVKAAQTVAQKNAETQAQNTETTPVNETRTEEPAKPFIPYANPTVTEEVADNPAYKSEGATTYTLKEGESALANEDAAYVQDVATTYIEEGSPEIARIIMDNYVEGMDVMPYTDAIDTIYEQARNGVPIEQINVPEYAGVDAELKQEIYNAAVKEGVRNVRTETLSDAGISGRNDVQNSRGERSGVAQTSGRTEETGSQRRQAERVKENAGIKILKKGVTTAELGFKNGTKGTRVNIADTSSTEDLRQAADYSKKYGLNLTAFTGNYLTFNQNGTVIQARGVIEGNNIYVKADHRLYRSLQIAQHEAMHTYFETDKEEKIEAMLEKLENEIGSQAYDELTSVYFEAYDESGLSAEEVFEEMFCDINGGMNVFYEFRPESASADSYESVLPRLQNMTQSALDGQNTNSNRSSNNEPIFKFSRDLNFKQQLDDWLAGGGRAHGTFNGNYFTLGNTPESLIKHGARRLRMEMEADVIVKITGGKHSISLDEIAKLPDQIAHPILLFNGSNKNSFVVLTEIFDKEGNDVIAAIHLNRYIDRYRVNKVASIYAKSDEFGNNKIERYVLTQINNGNLIDGDIKKAANWFTSKGLQLPELVQTLLSAKSNVSQTDENSKPKFSREMEPETGKNLVALHNLTAEKFVKTLKLGGLPMPSIAITKADIPHTNFGAITLVMDKSAIDPKANKKNDVYSADAWTPVVPNVEYEADEKVSRKLYDLFYRVEKQFGRNVASPFYSIGNDIESMLNRYGGVEGLIDSLKDDTRAKNFYLAAEKGSPISNIEHTTTSEMSEKEVKLASTITDIVGKEYIDRLNNVGVGMINWVRNHTDEIHNIVRQYGEKLGLPSEMIEQVIESNSIRALFDSFIRPAMKYAKNGGVTSRTEVDTKATNDAINNAVDQTEYEEWLNEIFDGVVKNSGVYNNKELYTPSGNRRTFAQTHYAHTLEGIVKAMAGQNGGNTKNVSGFHGVKTLRAGLAKRFSSISEMHKNEGRLSNLSDEEMSQVNDALSERLSNILGAVYDMQNHNSSDNSFFAYDNIGSVIMDIAESNNYTEASITDMMRKYSYNISEELATQIKELLFDISQMPTNMFEAKPARAVGFDEVLAAIVPDDTDATLVEQIKNAGIANVMTYESGNNADRMDKVNSVDGAKFSREVDKARMQSEEEMQAAQEELKERVKALEVEAKELAKKYTYFRGQIEESALTKGSKAYESVKPLISEHTAKGIMRTMIKSYGSTIKADEFARDIQYWTTYLATRGESAYDEVREGLAPIASKLVDNAVQIVESDADRIKQDIRTTRLKLTAKAKADIQDYNEWRKAHMGKMIISNNGMDISDFVSDMYDKYGTSFDLRDMTEADQIRAIADFVDTYEPITQNPYDYNLAEAKDCAVMEMMELMTKTPLFKPTYADKQASKIAALKKQNAERIASIRQQARIDTQDKIARTWKQIREQNLAKREAKKDLDLRKELIKLGKRASTLKTSNANRAAIDALLQDIELSAVRMTAGKAQKLNEFVLWVNDMKEFNSDFIAHQGHYQKALDALAKNYVGGRENVIGTYASRQDAKTAVDEYIYNHGLENADGTTNKLRIIRDNNGNFKVVADENIMSIDDVITVINGLKTILADIQNQNKLLRVEGAKDVYSSAEEIISDIGVSRGMGDGIHGTFDKLIVKGTLSPTRMMHRLTGYIDSDPLYQAVAGEDGLAGGSRKNLDFQQKATDMFLEYTSDKKFMKSLTGTKADIIKLTVPTYEGGTRDIEMTKAMRISIYLHSLNKDSMRHICGYDEPPTAANPMGRHVSGGGITLPNIQQYKKGNLSSAYKRQEQLVKITPTGIKAICDTLTDQEKAFAKKIHYFFNVVSPQAINEVSDQLLGRPIAEVENYYPISVDKAFLGADYGAIKFDNTIEGMGILKERVQSNKPVVIYDCTDVLMKSIESTGRYYGLAIPVRNINKLLGVTIGRVDENGNYHGYDTSVLKVIVDKWGDPSLSYIEKMIGDVQKSGQSVEDLEKAFRKLRSGYAGAVLSLNLSVAMKQAASYPTAAGVLGWAPLAAAMGKFGHVNLDLIKKYTPLQAYRTKGYSTTELGDLANQNNKLASLLSSKPLNWIQGVDLITTRKLWKASMIYVQMNNNALYDKSKGDNGQSDAFYREVAKIYNRVIEETQPNYTAMQRPELLRSNSGLVQTLMMFKTQPFQNFNMLYDAWFNMRAKNAFLKNATPETMAQAKADAKAARTQFTRAVTSQVAQLITFAAMTCLWNIMRNKKDKYADEDGNVTLASWAAGMGKDIGSGIAGYLPFASDIYEVIASQAWGDKYYGFTSVTDSAVSDLLNSVVTATELVKKFWETDDDGNPIPFDFEANNKKVYQVASAVSKVFGIPFDNVKNLLMAGYEQATLGIGKMTGNEKAAEYAVLASPFTPGGSKKAFARILYDAYVSGNDGEYEELRNRMLTNGDFADETELDEALKDAFTTSKTDKNSEYYASIKGNMTKAEQNKYIKKKVGKTSTYYTYLESLYGTPEYDAEIEEAKKFGYSDDALSKGVIEAYGIKLTGIPADEYKTEDLYEYLTDKILTDMPAYDTAKKKLVDLGADLETVQTGIKKAYGMKLTGADSENYSTTALYDKLLSTVGTKEYDDTTSVMLELGFSQDSIDEGIRQAYGMQMTGIDDSNVFKASDMYDYMYDNNLYNSTKKQEMQKYGFSNKQIADGMRDAYGRAATGKSTNVYKTSDLWEHIAKSSGSAIKTAVNKLKGYGITEDSIRSGVKQAFVAEKTGKNYEDVKLDDLFPILYSLYKSGGSSWTSAYQQAIDAGFKAKQIKDGIEGVMKQEYGVETVKKLPARFDPPAGTEPDWWTGESNDAGDGQKQASTAGKSSWISGIGYNSNTGELTYTTTRGATYTLYNVPEEVYEEWNNSADAGAYYHAHIKGRY